MSEETKEEVKKEKPIVLIAEDSDANRKVISHILLKLDFDVFAAIDGQAAWDYLKSNSQIPVLIISDIMMPNMGGFDLLKLVREEEKFKSIPFVFMTAALEKDYVIQAKTMKVDGYILKPVTSERIEKKIFELFPDMKRRKMTKIA